MDSTYSICSLSSIDSAVYGISWKLPFTIKRVDDTSSTFAIDSNFMYHLSSGNYIIKVFDSANCSMIVTNLTVTINPSDTITLDSTMIAYNWSGHGISTSVTVPYYPSLYCRGEYSVQKMSDSSFLPDTSNIIYLHGGSYKVKSIDTLNCKVIFTNLTIQVDTPKVESNDTSVSFCHWSDSSGYQFDTITQNIPLHIIMVEPFIDTIITNTLKEGSYIIKYFDTTMGTIFRTNLDVSSNNIEIDTTYKSIGFCNWQDYGIDTTHFVRYKDTLDHKISIVSSSLDSIINDSLTLGTYIVTSFNYTDCKKILTYLTITSDTSQIVENDSNISYCDFGNTGIDVHNSYFYSSNHITPFIQIIRTSPTHDTLENNRLTEGEYTVTVFATEECTRFITHYTVTKSSPSTEYLDTSVSYCNLFRNHYTRYIPTDSLPYTIIKTSPVIDSSISQYLNEGIYKIRHYDTLNCRIIETTLTVTDTSQISNDSTISYCNFEGGAGYATFNVNESLPHTIIRLTPTLDTLETNSLTEGTYIIKTFDEDNCKRYVTNLTVNQLELDTVYSIDTVYYSCSNDSVVSFGNPCSIGVIKNKFDEVVEPIDNVYYLNPHYGYYNSYCIDTTNCIVNKVNLVFSDLIEVPYTTDDYAEGTFDRRLGDSCCFVDIDHLSCSGKELAEDDEIEIFAIDPSMNTTFILKTTIHYYGESHILGFKFCPPVWDISNEHINDWYTIVMKKDTCDFCRFDFMCDSTNVLDMVAPDIDWRKKTKIDRNANQNVEPNITKVTNSNGKVSRIIIYPNPTSNDVFIKITNTPNNKQLVNVYDNTGKLVYTNNYSGTEDINIKINMGDFADGVYTISVPGMNYNYKLILIK